jgi:hypothetical protein
MKYYIDTEFLEGTQKEKFPISLFRKNTPPTIDLISIGIVSEGIEKTLIKPYDVYNETVKTSREYYAISKDFNLKEAWNRYDLKKEYPDDTESGAVSRKIYWIRENVLRPIFIELTCKSFKDDNNGINKLIAKEITDTQFTYSNLKLLINKYGKTNKQIAEEVKEFVYKGNECSNDVTKWGKEIQHEFYAYYADYDWVVFCWLFGKMIDLPKGFPMYCNDLKQELDEKVMQVYISDGKQEQSQIEGFDNRLEWIKTLPHYPKQTNEHNALADAHWNKELHNFLKSI